MSKSNQGLKRVLNMILSMLVGSVLLSSACAPPPMPNLVTLAEETATPPAINPNLPTPLPTREAYKPGELVSYIAQTGDSLPALAVRFNTTVKEIRTANPIIPQDASTMPPGFPMKIPIYYEALWGSSYQIIPDQLFVYGPAQQNFDPVAFVDAQPGWLKDFTEYTGGRNRRGGDLVAYTAINYSVSVRLLLAVLEYQTGALSGSRLYDSLGQYPLGLQDSAHMGFNNQLILAANILNNGYYGWRSGHLVEFDHLDGRIERPDPWQNAATVSLQYFFSRTLDKDAYTLAISGEGLAKTYRQYFGDPWTGSQPHIPGSLQQPPLRMPFPAGSSWTLTGGPHTGWGDGEPWGALDFAPPAVVGGCIPTDQYSTAVADGVIVRTDTGVTVLDLDGDGDERTGWVIFYLHLLTNRLLPVGTHLKAGDAIGYPSCDGGHATGTHVHIARKYNGEWIPAESAVPFNLEGWIAHNGSEAYDGSLVRYSQAIRACTCSDKSSQVQAQIR